MIDLTYFVKPVLHGHGVHFMTSVSSFLFSFFLLLFCFYFLHARRVAKKVPSTRKPSYATLKPITAPFQSLKELAVFQKNFRLVDRFWFAVIVIGAYNRQRRQD